MPSRRALALTALVLACAAVFVLPVGRRPLYNQDEVRYAMLARDVAENGQWFLPRVRDAVYLNKPPLFFWAVALVSLPVGRVSDVTAPLVSVVSALAGLLGVFAIGRRLWGFRVGFAAAAILAATPFYFFMAHQVLTDMMLTAWLVWALYFYLRASAPAADRPAWLGFYLCVAGALSTKGPVAILALIAAVVASAVTDGRAGVRALRLPAGIGLIALTTLPWLLPYTLQSEKSYAEAVLLTDYLGWYFQERADSRALAFFTYLAGFLPWALVLPLAVRWWWADHDRDRRRLLAWTSIFVVALALSAAQRSRYFLPVLPLLALLVGDLVVRAPTLAGARGQRLVTGIAGAFAGMGVVAVAALLFAPAGLSTTGGDWVYLPAPGIERALVALFLLAGAGAGVLAAWRRAGGFAVAICWAVALIAVLGLTGIEYPGRYAEWYSVRSFARQLQKAGPSDTALLAYPDANLAFDFYLRRPIREVRFPEQVIALVTHPAAGNALLIREERWTALRPGADPSWHLVASGVVGGRQFVFLLNRE